MLVENRQLEATSHLFGAPYRGWSRWKLAQIFAIRKLESLDYRIIRIITLFAWSYV